MSKHYDWNRALKCELNGEPPYPEIFDCIIIGAGPAGMTAAIYAARRKLKTLMVCGTIGGQMKWASDIENWTGVAQATGPELTNQFYAHIKKVDDDNDHFDLWLREGEKVSKIKKLKDLFEVEVEKGKQFLTKSIVITTGKIPRTLGIPGEKIAMKGNGLSFSATSDAPLYEDKKMAVIGGGNSAMDVALQLAKYTTDITIMTNLDHLIGESCLMHRVEENPRIKIKYEVQTHEIKLNENNKVCGLEITEGNKSQEFFECEGIFEEIGQTPATKFLEGVVELNDRNEIVVDRQMKTNIPGIFSGGDCTNEIHKQTIVAAGQGAIAALEAHEYVIKQAD